MKVIFAGGGTAGHINPAISVANYMKEKEENFEALFIGTEHGLEKRLVPESGYNIEYIDIEGFDRKNMIKNVKVVKKLIAAKLKCAKIIKDFKPDAVVLTGGYVSGPVSMAAHKADIPSIIHEQNVYPGLTVKGAEKYVDYVDISFPETADFMKDKKKCVLTGNPVREELIKSDYNKSREALGLGDKPFILIFGGSLGAERINNTVLNVIPKLVKDNKVSVLFGTGERNYKRVMEELKDTELNDDIKVVPYISNMHQVMSAADLVISRSGAITLSEIAILSKPSILIPSPNVVRNHQEQNAREFENHNAAVVICEKELTPETLYEKINELVDNSEKLKMMGKNAYGLAQTEALESIYQTVLKAIENRKIK